MGKKKEIRKKGTEEEIDKWVITALTKWCKQKANYGWELYAQTHRTAMTTKTTFTNKNKYVCSWNPNRKMAALLWKYWTS